MDVFEALYTTRAMRRMHPDPIPVEVEQRILDAAIRAPSGGNTQQWRFVLVDDPEIKAQLGPLYRELIAGLWTHVYVDRIRAAHADPGDPESVATLKMQRSAQHLADHFEDTPLLLLGLVRMDDTGGSIFPAVWSAMLAARAQGVGSALTTLFSRRSDEVLAVLGAPPDEGWRLACCVALGYPRGRWGVAQRRPAHEVAHRNRWGGDLGYELHDPLWSPTEETIPSPWSRPAQE